MLLNFGNTRFNAPVFDALSPRSGDHVLDIGFGRGVGLGRVLAGPVS
jgi:precorrin-6B methylase 2